MAASASRATYYREYRKRKKATAQSQIVAQQPIVAPQPVAETEPTPEQIRREVTRLKAHGVTELQISEATGVLEEFPVGRQSEPKATDSTGKTNLTEAANFPEFEPSPEEIEREVTRLKASGMMSELQISAGVIDFPVRKRSQPAESGREGGGNSLAVDAVEFAFCAVIVLGASALLVQSSADVFGHSIEGWAKAILLELGIVGLSVYRAQSLRDTLVSKIGAACLIALSLMTLHAGVLTREAIAVSVVESSSDEVQSLRDERVRLVALHDSVPSDHVTRREGIMRQVREAQDRVQKAKATSIQSPSVKAVELSHFVESLMRVALLFLNIVFAHRLVSKLSQHGFS